MFFFPSPPCRVMCAAAPDGPKWAARGAVWRMGGWEVGKKRRWTEAPMSPHQTALNGRPGAVKVRGEKENREV